MQKVSLSPETQRIADFMAAIKINATELAQKAGYTTPGISKLMNANGQPSSKLYQGIATAFPELNMRWLLIGEGDMFASISITQGSAAMIGHSNSNVSISSSPCDDCEKQIELLKQLLDEKERLIQVLTKANQ
jgi:transcriptional regulator with XRE-family HTH domain